MSTTRKILALIATLAVAAVLGGIAQAALPWHVFATGQDSGDYGAYASASASASKPHVLAIRSSAEADVNWTIICDATTHVRAGQVIVLSVAAAGSCQVNGSASTSHSGLVKIQLLRR